MNRLLSLIVPGLILTLSLCGPMSTSGTSYATDDDTVEKIMALIKKLDNEDTELRKGACAFLKELGTKARPALPALGRVMLKDKDGNVRALAEGALASILGFRKRKERKEGPGGGHSGPPAPGLSRKEKERQERQEKQLEKQLKEFNEKVKALIKNLDSSDEVLRFGVCGTLRDMGCRARPAIPALTRLIVDDKSAKVRRRATEALASILGFEPPKFDDGLVPKGGTS